MALTNVVFPTPGPPVMTITFDTNANRKNERAYVDDVLVQ